MYTLAELAEKIGAEFTGNAEAIIRRAQAFEAAEDGDVTFATDAAYRARLSDCQASAVIIAPPVIENSNANLILTKNPKLAFARALQVLHATSYQPTGISADLIKGEDCLLGEDLSIHPRVTLGSAVMLGNCVTLHPGVV